MLVRPLIFLLAAGLCAQAPRCPSEAHDVAGLADAGSSLSREGKYSLVLPGAQEQRARIQHLSCT